MKTAVLPQLIFHIGDPKTGTSSIQTALQKQIVTCDTRSVLAWKTLNAIPVANCLKPKSEQKRETQFNKVRDWLNGASADIAVVSSEFFSGIEPSDLQQALVAHVPDHADKVKVIAYVRPHASRFLAAYIQRTKTGAYMGNFDDFFPMLRKNDPLNYSRRFGAWQKVFSDRFVLRPFLRPELRNGDIVSDFFNEIFEGAAFTLSDTVEENVSVTLQSLCGLRIMHRRLNKAGIGLHGRAILGGAIANFFLPAGKVIGDKPKLDRAMARTLIDAYSADAKNLDATFFSGPIMQENLETCIDKAVEHPIDLTPNRYFEPYKRKHVVALSDDLAKLFHKRPKVWSIHYQTRKGQLVPDAKQSDLMSTHQEHVALVDEKLAELAQIFSGDPEARDQTTGVLGAPAEIGMGRP